MSEHSDPNAPFDFLESSGSLARRHSDFQEPGNMSLSRDLVRTLHALHGPQLSAPVSQRIVLHIADSIGIALAARREAWLVGPMLAALDPGFNPAAGSSARGCGVLGGAEILPAPLAAFANAALAHALDYDDIHDLARLHPTTVTFPAALAAAGLPGADASRLTSATALGNEVMCRLGLACSPQGSGPGSDWFLTQLFGYIGAALAAGTVLGLNEDQLVSALGFAYMQAAGGKEAGFGTGMGARAIYPAFAAMGGVTAALLARTGLAGPEGSLDGTAGLLRIYLGLKAAPHIRARLLDDTHWHAIDTSFKPWPCCRLSHPYIAVALQLRERLRGRSIECVVLRTNRSADRLCHPLEERRRPRTLQDAKYSLPFMTAFALVHGAPQLTTLTDVALLDAAVLNLAARISVDSCLPDRPGHPQACVQITLVDGTEILEVDVGANLELDASGIRQKFIACTTHARHFDGSALWDQLQSLSTLTVDTLAEALRLDGPNR
jgi:2-methylcitrate dehydratase PrpD